MTTERTWKKPQPEIEFIRPSKLEEDKINTVLVEGTFLESIPNHYDNSKLDFKFETEDGKSVVINAAGNLGYRMKSINPGQYVRVTYEGKQEIASGKMKGKLAHNFDVEIGD